MDKVMVAGLCLLGAFCWSSRSWAQGWEGTWRLAESRSVADSGQAQREMQLTSEGESWRVAWQAERRAQAGYGLGLDSVLAVAWSADALPYELWILRWDGGAQARGISLQSAQPGESGTLQLDSLEQVAGLLRARVSGVSPGPLGLPYRAALTLRAQEGAWQGRFQIQDSVYKAIGLRFGPYLALCWSPGEKFGLALYPLPPGQRSATGYYYQYGMEGPMPEYLRR